MKLRLAYLSLWVGSLLAAAERREIQPDPATGSAAAVAIPDVPLVHTASFMARDPAGGIVGRDVIQQTEQVLDNIQRALVLGGSDFGRIVKLNMTVREPAMLRIVHGVLARRFSGRPKPALTLVVSDQVLPDALVSGDAVAAVGVTPQESPAGVRWLRSKALYAGGGETHAAVLPHGARVFLSGKGRLPTDDQEITVSTRAVMSDLELMLKHVNGTIADIVHLRVMMVNLEEAPKLEAVLDEFFGGAKRPPVAYIERMGNGSIDIDAVATSRTTEAAATLEFLTPPKWTASPRATQVVKVNRGGLIYTSGMYGDPVQRSEVQATEILQKIEGIVRAGGSDFHHLAKGMYYILNLDGAGALDVVRPRVFPPDRAPAASRNLLRHMGGSGGTIAVDMIAVIADK